MWNLCFLNNDGDLLGDHECARWNFGRLNNRWLGFIKTWIATWINFLLLVCKAIAIFIVIIVDSHIHIMNIANIATEVREFANKTSNLFTITYIVRSNQIMNPLYLFIAIRLYRHHMYGLCTFQIFDRLESLQLCPIRKSCMVWNFNAKVVHLTRSNIIKRNACITSKCTLTIPMLFNMCFL